MEIIENKTNHGTVLTVTRSLDRTNCPELDHALSKLFAQRREAVWIDVEGLMQIDSAGLTLMLRWHRQALAEGRRFAFVGTNEYHRKLFEITRLDQELVVFDAPGGSRVRPNPTRGLAWRTRASATEPAGA
jgi:anti-sigma B factor antagonist